MDDKDTQSEQSDQNNNTLRLYAIVGVICVVGIVAVITNGLSSSNPSVKNSPSAPPPSKQVPSPLTDPLSVIPGVNASPVRQADKVLDKVTETAGEVGDTVANVAGTTHDVVNTVHKVVKEKTDAINGVLGDGKAANQD